MKINPLLYDQTSNHNPTKLLSELFNDIKSLSIKEVYKKYESILSPQEICGFLTQEASIECSKQIIMYRANK